MIAEGSTAVATKVQQGHCVVSRLSLQLNSNNQLGEMHTTAAKQQSVEEDVVSFYHTNTLKLMYVLNP